MNDPRVGAAFRALRRRRRWRQVDVAAAANVSQPFISKLERGQIGDVNVDTLRSVAATVEASLVIDVRWQGGALDRLLDERHASLLGATVDLLAPLAWGTEVEVTYSHFGERGSIDILAFHAQSGVALVIEIKTELVSIEATLRKLDEKVRLAGTIARERFEWRPAAVARMLVLPSTSTERRRVARHAAVLDAALPLRYDDLRAWLRRPAGPVNGLLFVANITRRDATNLGVTSRRVRRGQG
ncbi:MAG TPA: XRE family transcriptional regulator [Candidatus Limnocylindrales bacterium]